MIAKAIAERTDWDITNQECNNCIGKEMYLNNRSGLSFLPAGERVLGGKFNDIGIRGFWWSTTEESTRAALACLLSANYTALGRGPLYKICGFSVRIIKD